MGGVAEGAYDPVERRSLLLGELGRPLLSSELVPNHSGCRPLSPGTLIRCDEREGTRGSRAVVVRQPESEVDERGRERPEHPLDSDGLDVRGRLIFETHDDAPPPSAAEGDRDDRALLQIVREVRERTREGARRDERIDGGVTSHPAYNPGMAQGHSIDDYIETIYFLAFPIGEYHPVTEGTSTLAVRIADMLGVSRASAGEMLKRLEAEGLVERGEQKEAILTPKGRELAERVVRRHRIIERLLTDFMGYTPAESHVQADVLGDTFTDEMIERIAERLGNPDRCPHGWPVDTEFEQAENRELKALADLELGTRAEIVRLAEHDGELLHWFYDEGFTPGTRVVIREKQPAAGQFKVVLGADTERAIGERAAAGLYVRPS